MQDANSLYGFIQHEYKLPTHEYQLLNDQELQQFYRELKNNQGRNLDDFADVGYFFSVTLSYPPELHDLHSQYPLLPVAREVLEQEMSPFAQAQLNGQKRLKGEKLIADLKKKERYTIHFIMVNHDLRCLLTLSTLHPFNLLFPFPF